MSVLVNSLAKDLQPKPQFRGNPLGTRSWSSVELEGAPGPWLTNITLRGIVRGLLCKVSRSNTENTGTRHGKTLQDLEYWEAEAVLLDVPRPRWWITTKPIWRPSLRQTIARTSRSSKKCATSLNQTAFNALGISCNHWNRSQPS